MRTAQSLRADACSDRLTRPHNKLDWCFPRALFRAPVPLDWYWAEERAGLLVDSDCLAITSRVSNSSAQTARSCAVTQAKTSTYFGRCVEVAATSVLSPNSK